MGYNDNIMDNYQPNIVITDWYAGRRDCGSEYQLLVQLLSQDKKPIQEFCPQPVAIGKCNDTRWQHMTHMFSNYGPGVRYVYFQHGGNSTQNWAGSYGARVTNSSVSIEI
ncbi:F-box only protein 44-like isoform 1-T2 [Mantella aurantiaca]